MSSTISEPATRAVSIPKNKQAALSSIFLGSVFIFMIGFSHISVVHNAAHDTRHSSAFPCH